MNEPVTEGHIQIIDNFVKALSIQKIESIVFNYKYRTAENGNHGNFLGKRFEQRIPLVGRENLLHKKANLRVAYCSLMETASSIRFILTEKRLRSAGRHYVTNVVNCFRYPRILAQPFLKTPLVVHFYMRGRSEGRFFKIILDKADKIVASSKIIANHLQKTHNIEAEKIIVLYPPIDVNFYRPISKLQSRKSLGLSEKEKILLYVGNIGKSRFTEQIVLPMFQSLSKYIPMIRLIVLAPKNLENILRSEEIRSKARQLNIENLVKVSVQNLAPNEKRMFYSLSDIFIFPSTDEGIVTEPPITILEAMASSLPVFSNDLSSLREIITDGKNGIITSFDKEREQMTNKIAFYLKNEEILKSISFKSRQYIVDKMSLETSGKKIRQVYEGLF
jgi:glycosyltransferase involved in cell wall biosynthesis